LKIAIKLVHKIKIVKYVSIILLEIYLIIVPYWIEDKKKLILEEYEKFKQLKNIIQNITEENDNQIA